MWRNSKVSKTINKKQTNLVFSHFYLRKIKYFQGNTWCSFFKIILIYRNKRFYPHYSYLPSMCILILRPFFILAVIVGVTLTAVSMGTPNWRKYSSDQVDFNVGILAQSCGKNGNVGGCNGWWEVILDVKKSLGKVTF